MFLEVQTRAGKICTRCMRCVQTFCPESRTFEDILSIRSRTFVVILEQELRIDNSRLRIEDGDWGLRLRIEEVLRMMIRIRNEDWGLRIKEWGLRMCLRSRTFVVNLFVENHALSRTFHKPQNVRVWTFWAFFQLCRNGWLGWPSGVVSTHRLVYNMVEAFLNSQCAESVDTLLEV